MKFCVNITSGALAGTLEDNDLRGEGRWERLVARGLLNAGHQVGTPQPKWGGDSAAGDRWLGHIEDPHDSIYVTIYGGPSCLPQRARAYLLHFFSGPNAPIEAEFRELIARVGRNRVFFTSSYPSAGTFDKLAPDLRDRVAHLPMPVPDPTSGDPTDNTVLFYPSRLVDKDGPELLRFVRRALDKDASLTFEALATTYSTPACELRWEHPLFRSLFDGVRSRVTLHQSMSHAEVQKIYARTRLVVCSSGYGGPPLESARCGLPVVAYERDCSLYSAAYTPGFPQLPRLGGGRKLVDILERLLFNKSYAREVGDACRRYVAEHYSAAALGRAVQKIEERIS